MANTKIDIINDAYSQMRISGLTVDPSPEDVTVALIRLENMVSEFDARNICTGYSIELDPDPNSLTNADRKYWHMLASNLAVRLAADFGQQIPQSLAMSASASLATASSTIAADGIRQVSAPNRMPLGSGVSNRYNNWQRFNRNPKLPPEECETNIIVIDNIDDYVEDFSAYLNDGEFISSYTITADNGITILSDSEDSPVINYRIRADGNTGQGRWQQVKIVATTSDGRITTRFTNFDVQSNETVGDDS